MAKHGKIQLQGMLLYLLVAIIPTIVLFGVYLHSLTLQMENEVLQTMQQTLNQAVINIENDMDDLKRVSDYLFVSASINESMATDAGSQTVEDQIQELDLINDTLQATMESSNLSSVRLYVDDQKIYARERDRLYPFSEFYSDPRFSDVTASGEFMLTIRNTLEGQEKYVSYVRLVKDIKQVGRTLGALAVDLDQSWFEEILGQINFSKNAMVYLADSQGTVLLGDGQVGRTSALWKEDSFQPGEREVIRTGQEAYIVQHMELPDWYLVIELPNSDLSASQNNGLHLILYVVLLMVFVGLILTASSLVVNGVARRVRQLASVFEGMASPAGPPERRRKFSPRLFASLDESLENARTLIRTSYEQMERQRSTQLQLLQAQINPHFLYNTLDTIQWLVCAGRMEDSLTVIAALTRYLRMILNNGRDVVTVRDELEMTKAYLEIQKVRFGDSFDLDLIVEPDVWECLLPKMTLQPVIENALLHGIRPLTQRRGRIDIDLYREEGFLTIAVTDNGVGMSRETMDSLLKLPAEKAGGYGLYNVNQRLLLFSNREGSGIALESEEGKYSMVTLRISERRKGDEQGDKPVF